MLSVGHFKKNIRPRKDFTITNSNYKTAGYCGHGAQDYYQIVRETADASPRLYALKNLTYRERQNELIYRLF